MIFSENRFPLFRIMLSRALIEQAALLIVFAAQSPLRAGLRRGVACCAA
jgi:hypothetical protein